jgi:hypothetical protein
MVMKKWLVERWDDFLEWCSNADMRKYRRRVQKLEKLYPLGSHLLAMDIYSMLKIVYKGTEDTRTFDFYVQEVRKYYAKEKK